MSTVGMGRLGTRLSNRARRATSTVLGLCAGLALWLVGRFWPVEIQRIWAERIGHLALEPELFLSRRAIEPRRRGMVWFYFSGPVSNEQVLSMWRRRLATGPTWLLEPVDRLAERFPWLGVRPLDWDSSHVDLRPLDEVPVHLSFQHAELVEGEDLLSSLGLPRDQPFVCLAVRDGAYLRDVSPATNWAYHDYRDSAIDNYREMAEYLTERGYAVLRMGKRVQEPLVSDNPLVVDYANSPFRSDLGDAFLFANCEFCITTSTGMDALAHVWRRPVGVVNLPTFGGLRLGRTTRLVMFKDMHMSDSGERLGILDERRLAAMELFRTDQFEAAGIEFRENSPLDLVRFAEEMVQHVQGAWHADPGQREVERAFLQRVQSPWDLSLAEFHLAKGWLRERRPEA